MPTYRVPVLVWQDHGGGYCACAVEPWLGGEQGVGVADTASDALGQGKNYLNWRYKQERWLDAPDLLDTEVIHLTVQVRPQYAQGDRVYPCDEPIDVRVPCVCGRQRSGLRVCSIPTLDIAFHYHGSDESKRLIAEKVRHGLSGLTPRELSRRLPPPSVRLAEVSVRVVRRDEVKWEPDLPTLRVIAEPIGQAAFRKRFTAAWQREAELADLTHRLGKEKAHVALVGDHGVGKSTLLVAAVRALERKTPTDSTEETGTVAYRHRHWWTSAARLIAGMKYLGQWEERLEEAIAELSQIGGVLCVENLLDLVLHGGAEATDSLAAFMLPYLQSGELRLVGEATPDEMNACRRLLPGLADVLQVLEVPRLDPASARQALRQLAASGSQETKIAMAEQGVAEVYRLFERFQPYQAMPGRAAALVRKLFDKARGDGRTNITVTDVVARFVRETGLPERLLHDDQPLLVEDLFKQFTGEVIGQDEACRAAAELIATFKAGMNNPTRPIGSMLFCGPTGVGKTEMAKVVSRYLFGAGETCGDAIPITPGSYVFNSSGYTDDYDDYGGTCGTSLTGAGPDVVYTIDVPPGSTLTVDMNGLPSWDEVLVISSGCPDVTGGCRDWADSPPATVTNGTAGTVKAYIVADGWSAGAAGEFSLDVTLAP